MSNRLPMGEVVGNHLVEFFGRLACRADCRDVVVPCENELGSITARELYADESTLLEAENAISHSTEEFMGELIPSVIPRPGNLISLELLQEAREVEGQFTADPEEVPKRIMAADCAISTAEVCPDSSKRRRGRFERAKVCMRPWTRSVRGRQMQSTHEPMLRTVVRRLGEW